MREMIHRIRQSRTRLVGLLLFWWGAAGGLAANQTEPGLAVSFTAADGAATVDTVVLPNVWLYVSAGQSPTPFFPERKFTAEWKGFIASEIRDNYTFQADLNGSLRLEINGAVALDANGTNSNTGPGKTIRLNKGTNAFKVVFASPAQGDTFVRLAWSTKEFPPEPIALSALSHEADDGERKAARIHYGRELFLEFRCAGCHTVPAVETAIPELAMDAPSFEGIGSRRNFDWMARWIADPKSLRSTAHMPKLLHGPEAKAEADAIAAFLASLKAEGTAVKAGEPKVDQSEAGSKLFDSFHCAACHNTPGTTENDPKKIPFTRVREKFAPGDLIRFLQKPEEHYAWIRMPDFKLNADEAARLAAFLQSDAQPSGDVSAPTDIAIVEHGRKLVQTIGCLQCHSLKLENQFKAKPLADLPAARWTQGCLADTPSAGAKVPQFAFGSTEREALRAFAGTDRASLTRHVPAEFAERQARLLRCSECHGKFEGFPPLEVVGGKLKPEWMENFIAGEVDYKPRPWLDARMPAFAQRARWLAIGLAEQHGYPPQTPAEPSVDQEMAKVGRTLVSGNGGFFCVSCHAVGSMAALQVFESNGINFAHASVRLQKDYFRRWVRNPLRIDPATKMPVYFDTDGRSPLADVYDGDGTKQLEAVWQYLRLGRNMPPPADTR